MDIFSRHLQVGVGFQASGQCRTKVSRGDKRFKMATSLTPHLLKILKRDGALIFESKEKATVLMPPMMTMPGSVLRPRFSLLIFEFFRPQLPCR